MTKKGPYAGISTEGPEFETIYSLGSMVGIKDPAFVIAADRLCDELGLDTISAGATAAMAMELYENGLFRDTDGLDMGFGNQEAVLAFLRMVAYKEGLSKGEVISRKDLDFMLDEYYEARGWNKNGIPTPEKRVRPV